VLVRYRDERSRQVERAVVVIEAALVWLKRFETSGLAVADMDPETQKLIVATRALRDLDADADDA
jgi:hypothetical protein